MSRKQLNINSATKQELRKYIRNNVNYVNSTLTDLEKAGKEYSPAYRYIIDKYSPKHKDLFVVKDGKIRFKARTVDIEKMSQYQLKQFASVLSEYKQAKTSSLYKIRQHESKVYAAFNKSNNTNFSYSDFEKLVQNVDLSSFNVGKLSSDVIIRFMKNVGVDTAIKTLLQTSDIGSLQSLYEDSKKHGAEFSAEELREFLKE